MNPITITEALAELKTIDKRIEKKREFLAHYLLRPSIMVDPLEKEGGCVSALKRERQAIADLETRKLSIRAAIRQKNETSSIGVCGVTRSIADWLVWRRDISPALTKNLAELRQRIHGARDQAQKRGATVVSASTEAPGQQDLIVHLSEQELADDIERLEETLGALDGQLSLKNATLTIEV